MSQDNLISAAIGIVFTIIVAVVAHRLTRRTKDPSWDIRTTHLIRVFASSVPHVRVLYRDEDIPNLSVSKVVLWNRGREAIRREDIAEADPLRLVARDRGRILDAQVVQVNHQPTRFSLKFDVGDTSAFLGFDFLDKDNGAVLQVVHTGTTSDDLQMLGTIIGGTITSRSVRLLRRGHLPMPTAIQRRLGPTTHRRIVRTLEQCTRALLLLSFLAFLALGITKGGKRTPSLLDWLALGGIVTSGALSLFLLSTVGGRGGSYVLPAGLESFEQG